MGGGRTELGVEGRKQAAQNPNHHKPSSSPMNFTEKVRSYNRSPKNELFSVLAVTDFQECVGIEGRGSF